MQRFCDEQSWRSCFIGGIAVQRWGEPQVTRDVDMTLLAGFGDELAFIDTLLRGIAGEFAFRHREHLRPLAEAKGDLEIDNTLKRLRAGN